MMPHDGKLTPDTEGHWVGREKERYDFVLKYLGGNSTSRGYCVHTFTDKNGARFLTFRDERFIQIDDFELTTGDCFTCKATVNRHGINRFKYGKQEPFKETVLNRIKFKKYLGRAK